VQNLALSYVAVCYVLQKNHFHFLGWGRWQVHSEVELNKNKMMTNSSTIRQLQMRPIDCDHLKLDSWKIWKTENLEMGKSTLHDRTSWIELSSITFCSSSFIVFYMCMFVCTCLTSARFCAPVYWPSMSSFFFIPRNSWKFAEKYSDYSCIFLKMFREKSSGKKTFRQDWMHNKVSAEMIYQFRQLVKAWKIALKDIKRTGNGSRRKGLHMYIAED
jgi:hypothetical protein